MDRESFLQERRAICGAIEEGRAQLDGWWENKPSTAATVAKYTWKFLVKAGLVTFVLKNPLFLKRLLFK